MKTRTADRDSKLQFKDQDYVLLFIIINKIKDYSSLPNLSTLLLLSPPFPRFWGRGRFYFVDCSLSAHTQKHARFATIRKYPPLLAGSAQAPVVAFHICAE